MAETHRDEIAKLEALYAANPEGRVFTHLAEAYRKAGRLDEARTILEAGIVRHPEYPSAQVVLGRAMLDAGDMDGAATAFRRVLELDRHNLVALRTLGELAGAAGRSSEALHYYRELSHLDPSDEELQRMVRDLEAETIGSEPPVGKAWTGGSVDSAFGEPSEDTAEATATDEVPVESSDDLAASDVSEIETGVPLDIESASASAGFASGFGEPVETTDPDEVEVDGPAEVETDGGIVPFGLPADQVVQEAESGVEHVPEGFEPTVADADEPVVPAETIPEEPVSAPAGWWETSPAPDVEEAGNLPGEPAIEETEVESADWVPQDRWDQFAEPVGPNWQSEPAGEAVGPVDPDAEEPTEAELQASDAWHAEPIDPDVYAIDEGVEAADPGDEMVTETMAEVYASQGLTERAVEVYRQLRRLRPHDDRIETRLQELEEVLAMPIGEPEPKPEIAGREAREAWLERVESAWTGREGAADISDESPYAWSGPSHEETSGDAPIGDYFRDLLSWRPAGPAVSGEKSASAVIVDEAVGVVTHEAGEPAPEAEPPVSSASHETFEVPGGVVAPDVQEPKSFADTTEEREPPAASDELLLLDEVPEAQSNPPVPAEPTDAGAVEAAFEEWFGGEAPESPAEPERHEETPRTTESSAVPSGPESEEDLEMFRAWLQSLKK